MTKVALFYAIGATIFGLWAATLGTVKASWHGRPLRFPRLVSMIVIGLMWPYVIFRMIVPETHSEPHD